MQSECPGGCGGPCHTDHQPPRAEARKGQGFGRFCLECSNLTKCKSKRERMESEKEAGDMRRPRRTRKGWQSCPGSAEPARAGGKEVLNLKWLAEFETKCNVCA